MNSRIAVLFLLLAAVILVAQTKPRPRFADYAVHEIYKGKPAPPAITKDWRLFRTMIREGAKAEVEFAGHYTVPKWGCGAGCNAFVVVDSESGHVYDGPGTLSDLPWDYLDKELGKYPDRMEYHPNSRLFKINGCINERDCGFYDFLMIDGAGLRLIRRELLPKKYQPE